MPTESWADPGDVVTLAGNPGGQFAADALTMNVSASPAWSSTINQEFRVQIDGEILIVTNVTGLTWTVTRGADSTGVAWHTDGTSVTQIDSRSALANTVQRSPSVPQAGNISMAGAIASWGVTPPSSQPTVTGSRGSATAAVLAQVLTILAAKGDLVDATTA
jgi:hypothetical protein